MINGNKPRVKYETPEIYVRPLAEDDVIRTSGTPDWQRPDYSGEWDSF